MFKVTNNLFNNPNFKAAMMFLSNQNFSAKKAWNISRLIRQCSNAEKELMEAVIKLANKYFKKDENGKFTPVLKNGMFVPNNFETIEEGGQEKFDKEYKELLDIEVAIESFKINIDDLDGIDISPSHFSAIEDLITEESGQAETTEILRL